jgi:DNA-binding response OmpR family regulator
MDSESHHILVLEDGSAYRTVVAFNLSQIGFRVTAAAEAEKALVLARHEHFDLAIVDYYLPDLPGTDFIKLLRQMGGYENVPIIMLTARAKELNLRYLRDDLSAVVLEKTCGMKCLRNTVRECLKTARCAS